MTFKYSEDRMSLRIPMLGSKDVWLTCTSLSYRLCVNEIASSRESGREESGFLFLFLFIYSYFYVTFISLLFYHTSCDISEMSFAIS